MSATGCATSSSIRAREFIVDWPERSRRLVAEYRADTTAPRCDPSRGALVRELTQVSAEFSSAWRAQHVCARDGGLRHFAHARSGLVAYEQYVTRLAENAELKMTVLVPLPPTRLFDQGPKQGQGRF